MKLAQAIKTLAHWSRQSRCVFTRSDLRKMFSEDSDAAFTQGLRRLIDHDILVRASGGVFFYALGDRRSLNTIEDIAAAIRRSAYCYLSLESALSEHGVISQVPVDRITVMTTGRKGEFKTPFGVVEFTHTTRLPADIIRGTRDVGRPLRLAAPDMAMQDLARVGRNLHLVDHEELPEAVAQWLKGCWTL